MGKRKVKLRMGMHNRITIDRWRAIKDDLNNNISTATIAKRHGVSESTVRKVRRSRNYHEYRVLNDKRLKSPTVVIAPKSGLPYEDFGPKPLFFSPKMLKPKDRIISDQLDYKSENTARMFGIVMLGALGIVVLALVIVLFQCLAGGK